MKVSLKKYLGVLVILFAIIFVPINVLANNVDDEFNEILNNEGVIVIKDTSLGGKISELSMHLEKYNNDTRQFYIGVCNEKVTLCEISLSKVGFEPVTREIEIKYEEEFSEDFKRILTNGKIKITSTTKENKGQLLNRVLRGLQNEKYQFNYEQCNSDFSKCSIRMSDLTYKFKEIHLLDVEFKEEFSDEFEKILTDGKLKIGSTSINGRENLISNYLNTYTNEKTRFNLEYDQVNEDYTEITIARYDDTKGFFPVEYHVVDVEYNEVISEEYKKLLTNGIFEFKTIKPTKMEDVEFLLWNYVASLSTDENEIYFNNCNEDLTMCDIVLNDEIHAVKVSFEETNKEIKNTIDFYVKKFNDLKTEDEYGWKSFNFDLIDLEMINYYATTKSTSFNYEKLNEMFNYSQTIKNIFKGLNFTYDYDCRMGFDEPFYSFAEGGLNIIYENVYYSVVENIGTNAKNILYIPSNTEKTPEAFIKAAEKKIKDYMPNLNVKITKGASFDEYEFKYSSEDSVIGVKDIVEELIDINKTVDNVFIIDFGDFKVDFLIVADSTKEIKPEFMTYDVDNDISITSSSSLIPLDTQIKVEKLSSGKEYDKIIKVLDVIENEMFEIKLYSTAKKEYITKLDKGKFEVKIPIPEKLKGKTLIVYYVDENNIITKYDVNPEKEGYAIFETDHFSIYTLAEKKESVVSNESTAKPSDESTDKPTNETSNDNKNTNNNTELPKVPETFDGILNYVLSTVLSLIVLVGTTNYLKKKAK